MTTFLEIHKNEDFGFIIFKKVKFWYLKTDNFPTKNNNGRICVYREILWYRVQYGLWGGAYNAPSPPPMDCGSGNSHMDERVKVLLFKNFHSIGGKQWKSYKNNDIHCYENIYRNNEISR